MKPIRFITANVHSCLLPPTRHHSNPQTSSLVPMLLASVRRELFWKKVWMICDDASSSTKSNRIFAWLEGAEESIAATTPNANHRLVFIPHAKCFIKLHLLFPAFIRKLFTLKVWFHFQECQRLWVSYICLYFHGQSLIVSDRLSSQNCLYF